MGAQHSSEHDEQPQYAPTPGVLETRTSSEHTASRKQSEVAGTQLQPLSTPGAEPNGYGDVVHSSNPQPTSGWQPQTDLELEKNVRVHNTFPDNDALHGNVIGSKPEGRWQKFFFDHDPFKQEEYVRNASAHTPKRNIPFALAYFGLLIAYTVYAFVRYIDRPSVETYGQLPMSQAMPAKLTIEMECTTGWGCYNAFENVTRSDQWWELEAEKPDALRREQHTGAVSPVAWVTVEQRYNPLGLAEGYCSDVGNFTALIKPKFARASQEITLCYSRDSDDGVQLLVPFPNSYEEGNSPSLNVRVLEDGEIGMEVEVSMEASQVKTITVGADILRVEGKDDTQELFRADLFYNAKRPFNTAELRIRLEHRAGLRTISRPGSWMDVLANAGGASGFLLAVISGVRGFDPKSIASGGFGCVAE